MYTIGNDELRFRLESFGKTALEMAAHPGDRPLDNQEKAVLEAMRYSIIKGILSEASIFATLGHIKDMEYSFEQVTAWAEFKL